MTLVGTFHLPYLPSATLREVLLAFSNPDDYGAIYEVSGSHPSRGFKPSRLELDAAHWSMFLALTDEFEGVRAFSEAQGFEACWTVHCLNLERGEDAVSDARLLEVPTR